MDSVFICAEQLCRQYSDALEVYGLNISWTIDYPPWSFRWIEYQLDYRLPSLKF